MIKYSVIVHLFFSKVFDIPRFSEDSYYYFQNLCLTPHHIFHVFFFGTNFFPVSQKVVKTLPTDEY
jgi:hypothetical protein